MLLDQVIDVRARISARTNRTGALGINRACICKVFSVLEVHAALMGKRGAHTSSARWKHTVKHINAASNTTNKRGRITNAHQVARLIARHVIGAKWRQRLNHNLVRLANRIATNAITGTNGKTTTTSLVGEIFERSKRKTSVVGNIGKAVIGAALEATKDDWLVTEVSSFQLETTREFRPLVSAILNLTPDHLNRHHTMEAYGAAKAKIFANQNKEQYLIINYDDKLCFDLAKDAECTVVPFSRKSKLDYGVILENNKIYVNDKDNKVYICDKRDIRIIGDHNVENVLAAVGICYFAGIAKEVIAEGIRNFGGVEHRIEFCAEIRGVKYYNDSKGTNVDASLTALRAIKENIILIAGGDGKQQNFDEFTSNFDGAVKKLLLFGRDAHIIAESADKFGFNDYENFSTLDECVERANELAQSGDTVLLSPACASWDMYESYERRGEHFKRCVEKLK